MSENGADSTPPPFPRLQAAQTVRLTREWSAIAWTGSPERLVAVQRAAEEALEGAYDAEVSKLSREDRDAFEHRAGELGESLRLRVKVTGNAGRLSRGGELSRIFAEMDLSEVETVKLANEPTDSMPLVDVRFTRNPDAYDRAIEVKVSGSDRQWVGGVRDVLVGEIRKGGPWWAFLRGPWFSMMLGALLAAAGGLYWNAHTNDQVEGAGFLILVTLMLAVLGALLALGLIQPIMRAAFPSFEIVEQGSSSRGRRVLGGLFALVSFGVSVAGLVLAIVAM